MVVRLDRLLRRRLGCTVSDRVLTLRKYRPTSVVDQRRFDGVTSVDISRTQVRSGQKWFVTATYRLDRTCASTNYSRSEEHLVYSSLRQKA